MLKIAAIVGPTAVGKSKIAVEVAGIIGAEIISADSVQVYKGMNIGAAKITLEESYTTDGNFIPHHMLDIVEPDVQYSVADYKNAVEKLIPEILGRNKLPLLVGGTGLYIQAIIDPYQFEPIPTDWEYRRELHREAEVKGNEHVHGKLALVDPVTAARLHPNDLRRVIRALEVFKATGRPIWAQHRVGKEKSRYNLSIIGLTMPRELLYKRIDERVEQMIAQGFITEVENLLAAGYSCELPAMQSLGYKQICLYLNGKCTLEEAVSLIKRDTRRFAKRQLTWFKRDHRIKWYELTADTDKNRLAAEIATEIGRTINT